MAQSSEIPKQSHLLVAAFDFGTTYSGYAFSFRSEPFKIYVNQTWYAGSKLISLKTPTCILLDPEEKFHSFGFDAENKYNELSEDGKHHGWLFFRRFKMVLHNNKKLSRKTTVRDINGKMMFALDIFSMTLRYLQCHLFDRLTKRVTGIKESDIKYVITIPAIWDDSGKQFMRMAAVQAGLDTTRVRLALEPEAASLWCQTLTAEGNDLRFKPGAQYMVVDLGGGTADISVHEKNEDGTLKELHKASGGPWGGMYVDNNFIQWLEKLFGRNTMERFRRESMSDYFDMLREFESNKRLFSFVTQKYMTFKIPAILREIMEKETGKTLQNQVNSSGLASSIEIKRDRMSVKTLVVESWFVGPTEDIITHIQGIFGKLNMKRVSVVLLVGGFGESDYVQDKIKTAMPDKNLIVPEEASLAVLKGAVTFGHQLSLLSSRIIKYSYGVRTYRNFDETIHDVSMVSLKNGVKKVANCFMTFVNAGDIIEVGHERKEEIIPTDMDVTTLPVYCSSYPNPSFTTDPGCEYLGTLKVYHSEGDTLRDKELEVMMIFGDTEIKVKARIRKTGSICSTVLDML